MDDVPTILDQLIRARGEDYASLSRFIGRNPAYIQQFIRRGSPKRLAEHDRARLAQYLGVGEDVLGGPTPRAPAASSFCAVPQLSVEASAGPGTLPSGEAVLAHFGFDRRWLRTLSRTPDKLSIISVRGDSMQPTLAEGDDILVDTGDGAERLRDGIYVLRVEGALLVKRLARNPATGRISIRSDNLAYPAWDECAATDIHVIGRVVWAGRRMS